MGEPRRLTTAVRGRIIEHVSEGNYPEVAAQLAGIPRRTFQRWLHDGRQDLEQGVEHSSVALLALAVEKARAQVVASKVKRIQQAGERQWQADAWWLERNFPALYGRRLEATVESVSLNLHAQLPAGSADAIIARYAARHSLTNPTGELPALPPAPPR